MFPLCVEEQLDWWPEKDIRSREWVCQQWWMKAALDVLVERFTSRQQADEVGQSSNVCDEQDGGSAVQNKSEVRCDMDTGTAKQSSSEVSEMVSSEEKSHHVSVSTPADLDCDGRKGSNSNEVKFAREVDQVDGTLMPPDGPEFWPTKYIKHQCVLWSWLYRPP